MRVRADGPNSSDHLIAQKDGLAQIMGDQHTG